MMNHVCAPEKCKGCGLCQNICPINCITLTYNAEGFLDPIKDLSQCIQCGLCSNRCIAEKIKVAPSADSTLYCAQSLDSENISNCTSGGIFGELAKVVIEKYSGVVYGAVYENAFRVKHTRAETIQETLPMHYSKYVQSDTSGVYQSVKKDILNSRTVLFTGTPCQVTALRSFLGKEYENLLCMDVLCHGVMSTNVLRDYIRYVLPSEQDLDNLDVCFRSKKIPQNNASFVISRDSKILYYESFYGTKEGIGRAFGGQFANREVCTSCAFRELGRYSDITVGDYVKENVPNTLSHSLVLVNTEKGNRFFEQMSVEKRLLADDERTFSLERVKRKVPQNKLRKRFFKMYTEQGINETTTDLWKSKDPPLWRRICLIFYKLLKRSQV